MTEVEPRFKAPRIPRTKQLLRQFHGSIEFRSKGRCEACVTHRLPECSGRFEAAHHVVPRSRGQGWPYLHSPERNGLGVSHVHHQWIHDHPAEAARLGFLLSRPRLPE